MKRSLLRPTVLLSPPGTVLCTYIYRRTGNVYTGAFTVAAMAAWIITGGSAML